MKKLFCTLLACSALNIGAAQAMDRPMAIHEIHSFADRVEDAINTEQTAYGMHVLNESISDDASFENMYAYAHPYSVSWHYHHRDVYRHHKLRKNVVMDSNGYKYHAYAYPNWMVPVSYDDDTKKNFMERIETKKKQLPGYQVKLNIKQIHNDPLGRGAVIHLDMDEASYVYSPYDRDLMNRITHTKSSCKMLVSQDEPREIKIDRMVCQKNSTLPM